MASWTVEPARLSGTWVGFRQAGAGWPPLWHPGPASAPARQPAARWHDDGEIAQYLSLSADGAWAELVRYEHLRSDADRLDTRRRLWACTVALEAVADLRSFTAVADELGLDPAMLVSDDHTACRALAGELRAEGYDGVLAPSAAIAGTVNLTVFGGRREIAHDDPALVALGGPAGNPRPELYVPVQQIADDAAAPPELLVRSRLRGDPHVGYEAWRRSRR